MLHYLYDILYNKIFLSAFLGWISAQVTKTVISIITTIYNHRKQAHHANKVTEDVYMFKDMMISVLWKTGGMPSSHTAMSSALTMAIGFQEGFTSTLFFISFFFTSIVIRDAMGVRLLAGQTAKKVNTIIEKYSQKIDASDNPISPLKVSEGHSFSEVFVGIVLGVIISVSLFVF